LAKIRQAMSDIGPISLTHIGRISSTRYSLRYSANIGRMLAVMFLQYLIILCSDDE